MDTSVVTEIKDSIPERSAGRPRISEAALLGLLLLICVAVYANTLGNGFVYDDKQQVLENAYLTDWRYIPQIFGTTVWSFVGEAGTTNYYRPLMTFSYLVLWQTCGDLPYGFHLLNLLVNAGVVLMVFLAGRRIFADSRIGWVAALLFAVHPVHTEAVSWIASLPDLQVTFFALLCLWLFADPAPRNGRHLLAILASFLLALLSKEPAIMLAPLALAFEHGVSPRRDSSGLASQVARYAPLGALAVAYLLLRIALFGKIAPVLQRAMLSWPEAIYSAFALTVGYARLLVFPVHLSAFHVFHASHELSEPLVLAGILIVALGIAGILFLRKRAPAAAFALLWAGVTLAPVLNARWMASNVLAERYLYLPSVGFCWFVAWGGVRLWDSAAPRPGFSRSLRPALAVALCALSVLGCARIISRNTIWRDDLTLYTDTLKGNPEAYIIQHNLGAVYFDKSDYSRAQREWEAALAGKPDNVVTMNALALVYARQDRPADAEAMYLRAIAAKPLWGPPHANYGLLLQKAGNMPRALTEFQTAVHLSPLNAFLRQNYGEALLQTGDLPGAEFQLEKAVELHPSLEALHSLTAVYLRQNRKDKAETILRRTTAGNPYDSQAHFELGGLLETAGKYDEAAKEYEAGLFTDPGNASAKAALKRIAEQKTR
ncbi:MAG: tetratricopeptide repeat protein [Acidobacteriia bacterium]|nr:tetratricopeptide repeat protein [Terriglobia bacterium]